jgi:acetoacetate decarboxylase
MMKIDDSKYYRMPLIMGPFFERAKPPRLDYPQIESVGMQYNTNFDAIKALLPECYQPAKEPIVTVMFSYNDGLEFMAGGGYRIATVQVAARFDSEQAHVEGDYILVMFEDKTTPIIGGREDLGVPKLYADISPIKRFTNNHLRCEASLWGHMLFGIDLEPLKKQNAIVRLAASKKINKRPWLAYKYIPSLDGPPDADYPTVTKNDVEIEQLWLSKSGNVYFGDSGAEDIASIKNIIDALKTLQINQVIQTFHLRGSAVLRYDLSHRLQ